MITVSKVTEYRDLISDDYDLSQDSLLNYSEFARDTLLKIVPTLTEFTSVASSLVETADESLQQIISNGFVDSVKEKELPFILPDIESNKLVSTEKIASAISNAKTFDLGQSFGWIGNDPPTSQLSTQPQRCGCSACCGFASDFNNDSLNFQTAASANGGLTPQANTGVYYIDALLPTPANYWVGSTISYSFMTSVPSYYPWNNSERNNFVPFNATQANAARTKSLTTFQRDFRTQIC